MLGRNPRQSAGGRLFGLAGVEENAGFDTGFDLEIGIGDEQFDAE